MKKTVLSVIIPCYNDGRYLLEAVESVKKYKGKDYEIIIINDGSTDKNTLGVLKHLKKEGCLVIEQKHKGASSARNNGIKRARGKYFLLLDADNKIKPEYIRKGVKILEKNPDIGVVYSDVEIFGDEERIKKIMDFDFPTLLQYNYIDTCTVLRKEVWNDVGGFDVELDKYTWEDWVFWISVAKKGWKFHHIPKVLFYYRNRKDSRNKMADDYSMRKKLFDFIAKKYGSDIYEGYRKLFYERESFKGVLADKDNQVSELGKRLNEKDRQINEYQNIINNKDMQISELGKRSNEKDNQISEFDDRLSEKENEINNYQKIVSDKDNQIFALNETLLSMRNSLTWRSVQKFDWIIKPLLIDTGIVKNKRAKKKVNLKLSNLGENKEKEVSDIDLKGKKKILFINHEESRTGAPKIAFEIAKEMKKYYDIKMVSLRQGSMHSEFVEEFGEIIYPDYCDILYNAKLEKSREVILKENPDLVYVNTAVSYAYAIEAKKLGIPVIFHIHELEEGFRQGIYDADYKKHLKDWADIYIAVSKKVYDLLIGFGCDSSKIKLINAFVSSKKVVEKSEEKPMKDELNKDDKIDVLGLGSFVKRKGADFFIDAFNILNKEYLGKFKFVWIGDYYVDGGRFFEKAKGLSTNFILLGEKENPFPYLKQADIFLLPSREDPFPLVALEAMALEKPVIAFKDGGGIPEAIKDCGIVVDNMSARALANAILKLSKNKKLMRELSEKAKKKQRENYDSKVIMPKIVDLVNSFFKKKISIILLSYNYAWCIREAIDSVLTQDYENWELIVVDDGSNDNSVEIIKEYVNKYPDKIKLFFHKGKVNKGLAETYKLGLSKCDGEFVAFIEADDIWYSDYLSSKIPIFEKYNDVVLVYNNVEMFGDEEVIKQRRSGVEFLTEEFSIRNYPFYAFKYLINYNHVPSFSCFVVKADIFKDKSLNFNSIPVMWLDWWLLAQISVKGKFFYQYDKKTKWRRHEKSYDFKISSETEVVKGVNIMKRRIRDYLNYLLSKGDISDKIKPYLMESLKKSN